MARLADVIAFAPVVLSAAATLPAAADIREVEPDLAVPAVLDAAPAPGRRVRHRHPDDAGGGVYHVLYLPPGWTPGGRLPVVVEYAGNGPYRNRFGDASTGRVEGSKLGFGLTAGEGAIWLCLPYLNDEGTAGVRRWWGDSPGYDPRPTVEYCKKVVPWVCERYGGDPERVLLCGFSRGAIACNFIGLYDDEISSLWCGFVPFSHYDGVREDWGYPGADRRSAGRRLARLGDRPQFVLSEAAGDGRVGLDATRRYLESTGVDLGRVTFLETGFRNHDDAWVLRPSAARTSLRAWWRRLAGNPRGGR